MRVTISKCSACKRNRLVDRVADKWVCFACKQKMHITHKTKPLSEFALVEN
jgi:ribosomal protein L37AE/L43A